MSTIYILHDALIQANKPEDQDTLLTAQAVQEACTQVGINSVLLPWREQLWCDHPFNQNDIIFNCVETISGQAQLNYQAALLAEQHGIAYTGGKPLSLLLTANKIETKRLLAAFNLPTPAWFLVRDEYHAALQTALLQEPYIIKPITEESSVGIDAHNYLSQPADFVTFWQEKNPHISDWFAEKYIDGREFSISLFEAQGEPYVLPIPEMQFNHWAADKPKILGYAAKWLPSSDEYRHTAPCFNFPAADEVLLANLKDLAIKCWKRLQLSGYVRIDLRVDKQGRPWILEINVNPALAPDAGFVAAAQQAGMNYPELIQRIIGGAHAVA